VPKLGLVRRQLNAVDARLLTAADAVYKDDLLPLEGRPLLYDPQIKSF